MAISNISVGVDASPAGASALLWAAQLAAESGATLEAIHVGQVPLPDIGPPAGLESRFVSIVVGGSPGPTLVAESADSDLLVVGRSGVGKWHGLARVAEVVLGSTARHCVHHARTAVATVPEDAIWTEPLTVVVGLDGSEPSIAALEWALMNLPATCDLHVVRAFAPWVGDGLYPMDREKDRAVHESARQDVDAWVDTAMTRVGARSTPTPTVEVYIGGARDVLTAPGFDVDLIVVGERGLSGVAAMVLGSISDYLVRYAPCPVIVVPDVS